MRHIRQRFLAARRRGIRAPGPLAAVLALAVFAALAGSATLAFTGAGSAFAGCAPVGIGASGPAVAALQRVVRATPDGDFGPLTRAAVLRYQRLHRVAGTGLVDAATWATLPLAAATAACGAPISRTGVAPFCATLGEGDLGPAVAVLQRAIGASADGDFGPLTEAALRLAQRRLRLPVTGTAAAGTWAGLRLTGTPVCTGRPAPVRRTSAPSRPRPPADAAAQAAVAAEVTRLVAGLAGEAGSTSDPIAEQALRFARGQLGKPYLYGGIGPKGYDCSGLVMTAYRDAGLNLPRTAAEQYRVGVAVPLNDLQAGDLVFYASDLTKPATIYHVAIYAGQDVIINAPYTGMHVRTEPLFTSGLLPTAMRPAALLTLPVSPGDTGYSVQQVQQDLTTAGYPLGADGDDGPLTTAAVVSFQRQVRLTATGVVDLATWNALAAAADSKRG